MDHNVQLESCLEACIPAFQLCPEPPQHTHSLSSVLFMSITNQMLGCCGTKIPQWIQLASIVQICFMSNDKLISSANIADSALFCSTGEIVPCDQSICPGFRRFESTALSSCEGSVPVSLIGFCTDAQARLDGDIYCPSCWSCDITLTEMSCL